MTLPSLPSCMTSSVKFLVSHALAVALYVHRILDALHIARCDPSSIVSKCAPSFRELGIFVMWMHVDTAYYEWARVGVAVARNVTGPYRFLRSFRPHKQEARDLTVFQVCDTVIPPHVMRCAICLLTWAWLYTASVDLSSSIFPNWRMRFYRQSLSV